MAKKNKDAKKEKKDERPKYMDSSQEVRDFFHNIISKTSLAPYSINFKIIQNTRQKKTINISSSEQKWKFITDYDVVVEVNEDMFHLMDDESKEILFQQEIDKISIDIDSGTIKTQKPDLVTFSPIVSKYGIDKVARANNLNSLSQQQLADNAETFLEN